MNNPKISIIVPVYNVEKYLNPCMGSILNQSFRNYEIILVDDGSKDTSGELCDNYAHKYNFIRTIHKINGGLSDARNVGLRSASGDYVIFVDSDDYITDGSLARFNQILEESPDVDVVFLEAVKVFEDNSIAPMNDGYQKKYIYNKSHEEVMSHLSKLPKFPGSACTKLVKRNLIIDNDLYFQKGLISEDIDWVVRLLLIAEEYDYCEYPYYLYRQNREGSITYNVNINSVNSLMYIIKKWVKKPCDIYFSNNRYQNYLNAFMAYEYLVVLGNYGRLPEKDRMKVKEDLHTYSWLLFCGKNWKTEIISVAFRIFGLNTISNMLGIYLRHRTKSHK